MADQSYMFPNPEQSDEHGLVAIGGDLSPQRLLQAYSQGIFPWYSPGDPLLWWSPDPRLILIPNEFKVSKSLKKTLKHTHSLTLDTAFAQVLQACATNGDRKDNTWLTDEMIEAYTKLHHLGYAHSIEVWQDTKLIGGLYGVSLGKVFFGESMFHLVKDASKVALYYLCQLMEYWQFDFIDCQMPTPHLLSLGAKTISRRAFLSMLEDTLVHENMQGRWTWPLMLSPINGRC